MAHDGQHVNDEMCIPITSRVVQCYAAPFNLTTKKHDRHSNSQGFLDQTGTHSGHLEEHTDAIDINQFAHNIFTIGRLGPLGSLVCSMGDRLRAMTGYGKETPIRQGG